MLDKDADAEAEFGGLSLSFAYRTGRRAAGSFVTPQELLARNFGCIEVQCFLGVIDA